MKRNDLPERWNSKLQNYLKESGSRFKELSASEFKYNLKIELGDDSTAFFYYAFYWIDTDFNEIAVFTEHCGYHIFPLIDTRIQLIDRHGNVVQTDDYQIK